MGRKKTLPAQGLPSTAEPATVADLVQCLAPEKRAAVAEKIKAIEKNAPPTLCIRILPAFDFLSGRYGATITLRRRASVHRVECYGAPTADELVARLDEWCRLRADHVMEAVCKEDERRNADAIKLGLLSPADALHAASSLYYVAGEVVKHCDDSFTDPKPPATVSRWLQARGLTIIPHSTVQRIYSAHLAASCTWANCLKTEHVSSEKIG